jgi:hypothetical protein
MKKCLNVRCNVFVGHCIATTLGSFENEERGGVCDVITITRALDCYTMPSFCVYVFIYLLFFRIYVL